MILDDIVAARRVDLEAAKRSRSLGDLRARPSYAAPRRDLAAALREVSPAIIAEVKKASPSRGLIRADFDPVEIARTYARSGAAAVSVLTEERYFQGRLEYLEEIRRAVELPLLRKDFLLDPYQVVEARAHGADAILLIVAILDDTLLAELMAAAAEIDLAALVEVHDEAELERALRGGARIVGVNNRDLRRFVTSLEVAERLRPRIPDGALAVAESGIDRRGDVERLQRAGYSAFLVGESLMRAADPGAKLRELRAA